LTKPKIFVIIKVRNRKGAYSLKGFIFIEILWLIISSIILLEYAPVMAKLSFKDQIIVFLIFIIGGPFFAIVNILEAILNVILPEGWDNDDDSGGDIKW
jgi:hypothetical protein